MRYDKDGWPIYEDEVISEYGQGEQVDGYTEAVDDTTMTGETGGVTDLSTYTEPVGRVGRIGKEQVLKAQEVLQKYKDGKAARDTRIVEN